MSPTSAATAPTVQDKSVKPSAVQFRKRLRHRPRPGRLGRRGQGCQEEGASVPGLRGPALCTQRWGSDVGQQSLGPAHCPTGATQQAGANPGVGPALALRKSTTHARTLTPCTCTRRQEKRPVTVPMFGRQVPRSPSGLDQRPCHPRQTCWRGRQGGKGTVCSVPHTGWKPVLRLWVLEVARSRGNVWAPACWYQGPAMEWGLPPWHTGWGSGPDTLPRPRGSVVAAGLAADVRLKDGSAVSSESHLRAAARGPAAGRQLQLHTLPRTGSSRDIRKKPGGAQRAPGSSSAVWVQVRDTQGPAEAEELGPPSRGLTGGWPGWYWVHSGPGTARGAGRPST